MWYVVHTMAGLEQKCMQQCQQYVDQADYSEMFIPLYMAKKHFRKEWHDVEIVFEKLMQKHILFPIVACYMVNNGKIYRNVSIYIITIDQKV